MQKNIKELKVAFVTDSMLSFGGSDRYIEGISKLFNEIDIYTSSYNPNSYKDHEISNHRIIQFSNLLYRFLAAINPRLASRLDYRFFEKLDLSSYDLVISMSAGAAKNLHKVDPKKHISIIFTPPRYLWGNELKEGLLSNRFVRNFVNIYRTHMRIRDFNSTRNLENIVSISEFVAAQVSKYYRKDSVVIYPGIEEKWFAQSAVKPHVSRKNGSFLIVSRLYRYKAIDMAIEAAIKCKKTLIIAGSGPDEARLKKIAGDSPHIEFMKNLSDSEVNELYANAAALIFPGVEDFGYVPVEAMAAGTPVIYFNKGGVVESVGKSGGVAFESFNELCGILNRFSELSFDRDEVLASAEKFNIEKQNRKLLDYIEKVLYEKR